MIKHLNIEDKIKVEYCIPTWLRDEQIKINIGKVTGRVKPADKPISDSIAVANFGPSLKQTYREILKYKHLITCSGAIKFLWDKGLRPSMFDHWYHLDVDPREHKIKLLGKPHKGITYLPASACHPKYFDYLKGCDIKLWHIFANAEDAIRILPQGEWALTGGSSVGLRTLTMARFLGYRDLKIFGMDGNISHSGTHAAEHPNSPKGYVTTEVNGIMFKTTPSMLAVAKETAHELDEMPDVTFEFFGDGLVQEIMKNYERKKPVNSLIAAIKPVLITDEYRNMMRSYHNTVLHYGVGAGNYADSVIKMKESIKAESVLDYGCGKGYLAKALPFPIWEYDPTIEGKDECPRAADLVVCIDVLEHIEPSCLDAVLADLARCTLKAGFFIIHTGPAKKTLPDGRNTHLIQEKREWWNNKLKQFFTFTDKSVIERGDHIHYVVVSNVSQINKFNKIKAA
jgi:hypothetical protein